MADDFLVGDGSSSKAGWVAWACSSSFASSSGVLSCRRPEFAHQLADLVPKRDGRTVNVRVDGVDDEQTNDVDLFGLAVPTEPTDGLGLAGAVLVGRRHQQRRDEERIICARQIGPCEDASDGVGRHGRNRTARARVGRMKEEHSDVGVLGVLEAGEDLHTLDR